MRKPKLRALQESAKKNRRLYLHDGPKPELLEHFPSPFAAISENTSGWVTITAPEVTCLCPMTGQPDFATIVVKYRPRKVCVESKSYKLYLGSYRNHGTFHEAFTASVFKDLKALLDPLELIVEGQFTPRGGIAFWPVCHYKAPDARQVRVP